MIRRKHSWGGLLSMAAGMGLLLAPGALFGATFNLDYQTNGPSADFQLPLGESEIRFKKEPEYVGSQVVRSQFFVSPDRQDYIGFACDSEGNKLYLDLNRNLDLTDDPDGIRESDPENWGQDFRNVIIPVEQGGGRREIAVDLQIYGESWGRYTIRSSWGSDAVAIGGQTYRVAVVDDGDGKFTSDDSLFISPIGDEFEAVDESKTVELQTPTSLVLDGQPYALAYALGDDGKTLELSIVPREEKLVDVALTGEGIERLVLQDGEKAALFLAPGPTISLPAGRYRAEAWVQIGEGDQTSLWRSRSVFLNVREGKNQEPWAIGGPLVGKLTHTMAGSAMTFDQAVTGGDDETYSLVSAQGPALGKPKLRVMHEGAVIHVGEFEYG